MNGKQSSGSSAEEPQADLRRDPRWVIPGRLAGRMNPPGQDLSVVDLSLSGALVEHPDSVRPGTISSLTLLLPGKALTLTCRVIRSQVNRHEVSPTGAREPIYRTGVKFVEVHEAFRPRLEAYLASLKRKGSGPEAA
ncbi:MAG: PilZ domain-containing protein [Candidatus Methylomirabilales bacterium]